MSDSAIELEGISVTRARRRILHIPELRVPSGSFLGVVGPNGAGKTTLLRACASLTLPDAGHVSVFGRDPRQASAWERSSIRRLIGYVPQTIEYMRDLPFAARDIVSMGLFGRKGFFKKLDAEDHRKITSWIDRLGLRALSENTYRSLSGGEQRKVLIARAMVQEPKLLLLDEPAANLDLDWKEQLVQFIARLFKDFDLTVVMVSHETWQLPASCERVALMKGGRIVSVGPKGEALSSAALSRLYDCRVETVIRGGRFHALSAGAREQEDFVD
ncbi:metal ABC transporter ATP-binding protein [bacterium]|nr:metal ABC transporter ATP-binding protein [bacterium]